MLQQLSEWVSDNNSAVDTEMIVCKTSGDPDMLWDLLSAAASCQQKQQQQQQQQEEEEESVSLLI